MNLRLALSFVLLLLALSQGQVQAAKHCVWLQHYVTDHLSLKRLMPAWRSLQTSGDIERIDVFVETDEGKPRRIIVSLLPKNRDGEKQIHDAVDTLSNAALLRRITQEVAGPAAPAPRWRLPFTKWLRPSGQRSSEPWLDLGQVRLVVHPAHATPEQVRAYFASQAQIRMPADDKEVLRLLRSLSRPPKADLLVDWPVKRIEPMGEMEDRETSLRLVPITASGLQQARALASTDHSSLGSTSRDLRETRQAVQLDEFFFERSQTYANSEAEEALSHLLESSQAYLVYDTQGEFSRVAAAVILNRENRQRLVYSSGKSADKAAVEKAMKRWIARL